MSDVEFNFDTVERDGETMAQLEVVDTSDNVISVIDSAVFTQNLEAYVGSNNDESTDSNEITIGDIVRNLNADRYDYKNRVLKVVNTVELDNHNRIIHCKNESGGELFRIHESRLELIESM